jgi:nucleoside-triphosphatase THEP1
MSFADYRLNEIKAKANFNQKTFIVTGEVGSGKTGCIKNLIENIQDKKFSVSGVYSSRIMENDIITGYDVVNISTNKSAKFLRKEGDLSQQKIGRFYIFNDGLNAGNVELQNSYSQITIVDEIGKLELSKNGWYKSVKQLIKNSNSHLILTVRDKFVNQIIEKFGIKPVFVLNVSNENYEDFYERIITAINKNYNTE